MRLLGLCLIFVGIATAAVGWRMCKEAITRGWRSSACWQSELESPWSLWQAVGGEKERD